MTGADHCNARTGNHFDASAHKQHDWRIVDFFQTPRVVGSSRAIIFAAHPAAFAHSCCACSMDLPVASDWAEATGIPVASSSVRLAWNTRSALPKCSTIFLTRVGNKPGVRAKASQ